MNMQEGFDSKGRLVILRGEGSALVEMTPEEIARSKRGPLARLFPHIKGTVDPGSSRAAFYRGAKAIFGTKPFRISSPLELLVFPWIIFKSFLVEGKKQFTGKDKSPGKGLGRFAVALLLVLPLAIIIAPIALIGMALTGLTDIFRYGANWQIEALDGKDAKKNSRDFGLSNMVIAAMGLGFMLGIVPIFLALSEVIPQINLMGNLPVLSTYSTPGQIGLYAIFTIVALAVSMFAVNRIRATTVCRKKSHSNHAPSGHVPELMDDSLDDPLERVAAPDSFAPQSKILNSSGDSEVEADSDGLTHSYDYSI